MNFENQKSLRVVKGVISHQRLIKPNHSFSYKCLSILLDITNLEIASKTHRFFSVDKFPNAYLTIVSIEYEKNNNYLIKADLKIKNETHPIEFIANIQINKNAAIATGKIEIDRTKYGIKYKSKTWYPDIGDRFINDIFELYFNLVAFPSK